MKKRIFIAIHYLEIGGAETSLIGLLNAMDRSRYDVDLFVYSHHGELMKLIPDGINLLPEIKRYSMLERPMSEALRAGCVGIVCGRMLAKLRHCSYRFSHRDIQGDDTSILQYVSNCTTPLLPKISDREYDLAISFVTPHTIVRDKVKARKKIAWIHTDYSTVHVNAGLELPVWSAYDYIASISPDVTRSFVECFPSLAPKIVEIENILSPAYVRQRADAFDAVKEFETFEGAILLSVGRFCHAKNYDNVPAICKDIVAAGIDLRWYIIGYGGDEPLIRSKIAEAGMEEHVIILGKRENPYPYIKACDIYVQPSRYEGKSVTVREAQILCKPVAITAYPTAPSQIKDGVDGVIVPMDNRGCAAGIKNLIEDSALRNRIVEYLQAHDYGNGREVEKLYRLIDNE